MNKKTLIALGLLALIIVNASVEAQTVQSQKPSALIQKSKVVQQTIREALTVYGRIQPDPDAVLTISVSHAGLIAHVGVRLGQRVRRGDILLQLITAPTARMQYMQARSAVDYAKRELARQQRLLKEHLATKAQVDIALKALADARSSLKALEAQGQNKMTETLIAPTDGIVTQILVKQGDRVQADTAALAIASGNRLIARLGVEPEDIHLLKPNMPVTIHSVFFPDYQIHSRLRETHAMINPSTHLVDALAPIPPDQTDRLVLGSYLRADLQLSTRVGMAVPRSAVLQDDQGYYVFIVVDGKAKRVNVETGIESHKWTEITVGLEPGQSVVSVGNYVLRDGMAVREKE